METLEKKGKGSALLPFLLFIVCLLYTSDAADDQ